MARSSIGGSISTYLPVPTPNWWLSGAAVDMKFTTSQYYDSVEGADILNLLSTTRASSGYALTSTGTLTSFASNTPRITDLGLLIEDAKTNICDSSQDMSNLTYWSVNNTTTTANAAVAPDGTTTATKIIETAGGGAIEHSAYNNLNSPNLTAAPYTWSVYLKAAELNFACLKANINGISQAVTVVVNLTNGSFTTDTSWGSPTNVSSSVTALANGWYRVTLTTDGFANNGYISVHPSTTFTPTFSAGAPLDTSTGTNGIYAWGAQVELGAFATSYIPTTTTSVTRALDLVEFIGNLDVLMDVNNVSIVADVKVPALQTGGVFSSIVSSTAISILETRDSDFVYATQSSSAVRLFTGTGPPPSILVGAKVGVGYDGTGRYIVTNGDAATSNTDANLITDTNTKRFGNPGVGYSNITIRRATFWSSRLANATIQGFTVP